MTAMTTHCRQTLTILAAGRLREPHTTALAL
jgi:hypothetical protein